MLWRVLELLWRPSRRCWEDFEWCVGLNRLKGWESVLLEMLHKMVPEDQSFFRQRSHDFLGV